MQISSNKYILLLLYKISIISNKVFLFTKNIFHANTGKKKKHIILLIKKNIDYNKLGRYFNRKHIQWLYQYHVYEKEERKNLT